MNKSDSILKLAQALTRAQAEMPVVKMNAQNPFLKNKYADLGAVIETSRPVLSKYGLSVSQFPVSIGERVGVTTILMHESGEWLEDTLTFSVTDAKGLSLAQSSGVVISYARRYSWASVLGMYADEDVDGHTPTTQAKPQAMTLEQALKVKDSKGELYSAKDEAGLKHIIETLAAPADKKQAAKLILENRKAGK